MLLSHLSLNIRFRMQRPEFRLGLLPIEERFTLGPKLSLQDRQTILDVLHLLQKGAVPLYAQDNGCRLGIVDDLICPTLGKLVRELARVGSRMCRASNLGLSRYGPRERQLDILLSSAQRAKDATWDHIGSPAIAMGDRYPRLGLMAVPPQPQALVGAASTHKIPSQRDLIQRP